MIEVSFDGAASGNPGLAGGGLYIKLNGGREERQTFPLGILSSNHEAEFAALVAALRFCLKRGYLSVSFRTDSQLVNQALEKRYVKKDIYNRYLREALELIKQFELFFCKWIPDRQNVNADSLARLAIREQQVSPDRECDHQ
ncbi:reverse transcriptase-like protein [Sporolactobacillus sp. CQH2019]|uniref:reverse transcriptase-like protein n=1 Tax=Sporolactobacillus sp. CQH2019 TaxID=3023512 RepID=UPI00236748DF|nr:reverse transcriptase-like protein [Sporolactobacillus sp. CQH2019]MDD9149530.1 reverse transcriptase-like protein [Sporolactobacillus sp. CQH2019]